MQILLKFSQIYNYLVINTERVSNKQLWQEFESYFLPYRYVWDEENNNFLNLETKEFKNLRAIDITSRDRKSSFSVRIFAVVADHGRRETAVVGETSHQTRLSTTTHSTRHSTVP